MTTQGTIDEATSELLNDEGAKVAPGRGDCAHLYYCRRPLEGVLDITGFLARCGTAVRGGRAQCASCKRFQLAAMKDVQKTPAPATVKGPEEPWTEDEDYMLYRLDSNYNKWAEIASKLPGRTEDAIKKRALVQRCFRSGECETDRVLHSSSVQGPLDTRATCANMSGFENWRLGRFGLSKEELEKELEEFGEKYEKCYRVDIEKSYYEEYQGYATYGSSHEKKAWLAAFEEGRWVIGPHAIVDRGKIQPG